MFINADFPLACPRSKTQSRKNFGHEPSAELIAILTVYFVQGILGLARLAFPKDELALSPAQVSALFGIVAYPGLLSQCLALCPMVYHCSATDGVHTWFCRGYWEQSPG